MVAKLRSWQTVTLLFLFLLSPILALVAGMDKTLNIMGLSITALLFVGCVLLLHTGQLTPFYRFAGQFVAAYDTDSVPEVLPPPTPVPSSPESIPTAAPPSQIDEARWIDVDLAQQRVTAYEGQSPVYTTLASTGLPNTPTVEGQFCIWIKLRYDDMSGPGYYLEDVPYVMYFYQGYGFHGVWWHANFGNPMSHGCVNLPTETAEWLFNWADVGTLVNVHY